MSLARKPIARWLGRLFGRFVVEVRVQRDAVRLTEMSLAAGVLFFESSVFLGVIWYNLG